MTLAFVLVAALVPLASTAIPPQHEDVQCRPGGELARMPALREASGLAVSRHNPRRLWTHNDSGEPMLFALDENGSVTGRVRVTGATVDDWEAIAAGPCPAGSCLYVGDIGDNNAARERITIYRLAEPRDTNGAAAVTDVFHAIYPDGPHDAETLLVADDGVIYIVTKGETGPIGIYRFPKNSTPGAIVTLEKVAGPPPAVSRDTRITDGTVSPDNRFVAIRTTSSLAFYRAADLFAGRWNDVGSVDLTPLEEPQGEGVALAPGYAVFLAGEGGSTGAAGTFGRFACRPGA